MKTYIYIYNFDPLKPHFYIVKLRFTGIYIIFFIFAQKHRLWVLFRTTSTRQFSEYAQSIFWAEIWKISQFFYLKIFRFWGWNFLYKIIWIGVFSYWTEFMCWQIKILTVQIYVMANVLKLWTCNSIHFCLSLFLCICFHRMADRVECDQTALIRLY